MVASQVAHGRIKILMVRGLQKAAILAAALLMPTPQALVMAVIRSLA
jgi:hypothetical protein